MVWYKTRIPNYSILKILKPRFDTIEERFGSILLYIFKHFHKLLMAHVDVSQLSLLNALRIFFRARIYNIPEIIIGNGLRHVSEKKRNIE